MPCTGIACCRWLRTCCKGTGCWGRHNSSSCSSLLSSWKRSRLGRARRRRWSWLHLCKSRPRPWSGRTLGCSCWCTRCRRPRQPIYTIDCLTTSCSG
jgi:hypothetical protein